MRLNDIPGQKRVKKTLLGSFNSERLASTYLFYGDDGVGKWATAIALAALINCESPSKDENGKVVDACGECYNCRQIYKLNFHNRELIFVNAFAANDPESTRRIWERIVERYSESDGYQRIAVVNCRSDRPQIHNRSHRYNHHQ